MKSCPSGITEPYRAAHETGKLLNLRSLGLPPDPVIRLGPPPAADAGQSPPVANHGQTNGHVARPAQPETGVGYLRQIFDRTRRELQREHQDDPDALQLVDEIL